MGFMAGSGASGATAAPAMGLSMMGPWGMAAGLALSALGAAIDSRNANKAAGAADDAFGEEAKRQKKFRRDGAERFDQTLGEFTRENQDATREKGVATRSAATDEAIASTLPTSSKTFGGGPKVVQDSIAQALGDALREGQGFGRRLSRLSSSGDVNLANNINLNRSAQDLGQLASFAGGSARVAPLEAQAAFGAKRNPFLGQTVNAIGDLGTAFALTHPRLPAGSTGGTTITAPGGQRRGSAFGLFGGNV